MAQARLENVGTVPKQDVLAPALFAALIGAFLILGSGFAHIEAVHNAAHDARHAFAFPCH